jgi:hypothetical protein
MAETKSAKQKGKTRVKVTKKSVEGDTLGEGEIKFRISKDLCDSRHKSGGGSCGALYGLGFLGALVYYVSTAPDFWAGVVGFFKALLWPAFLVHGLLGFLGL